MKRLLGLTFAFTAGLSIGTAAAAEQERIRGSVVAISGDVLTVHTATGGDISVLLSGDTKYLTESRSDLNHIPAGSYVGAAAKNMGEKQVALDILVFPPSMKGANEGHFDWDKVSDTTLSGGARTASSMTNGSVAAVAGSMGSASVNSTMTNGSVATTTAKHGAEQLRVTYKGGEQTILVPPTAPVVKLQPGAASDLKPGDTVFVNASADNGKATAELILVGSSGVAPPI
jgi:hypothetical protein